RPTIRAGNRRPDRAGRPPAPRTSRRGPSLVAREGVCGGRGAGPRASINLVIAAKVRAAINGRYHVSVDDVKAVVHPILRHRIITNFTAQAKGLSSDDIITQIVEATPEPGQE
ncbi:MAG: hypothetical protein QF516_13000, partial [Pirellulaceae bacterium]|nr:hypothetical protein [Pirellulaceae bacterium]